MPSSIAHGLTAAAVIAAFIPTAHRRLYVAAATGAVLLDVDAIGRPFGFGDIAWLGGHRALTHSLPFAVVLAAVITIVVCRGPDWRGRRSIAWACLAMGVALHGVLDTLTNYGEGVMFFAPFSTWRYKAPWQPFEALLPEILVVWLPALAIIRYRRRRPSAVFGAQAT